MYLSKVEKEPPKWREGRSKQVRDGGKKGEKEKEGGWEREKKYTGQINMCSLQSKTGIYIIDHNCKSPSDLGLDQSLFRLLYN